MYIMETKAYLIQNIANETGDISYKIYDVTEFVEIFSKDRSDGSNGHDGKVLIDTAVGTSFMEAKQVLEEIHKLLDNPNYDARRPKFGGIYKVDRSGMESISFQPEHLAYLIKRINLKTQEETHFIGPKKKYSNSDHSYDVIDSTSAETFEEAKKKLMYKYPKVAITENTSESTCAVL